MHGSVRPPQTPRNSQYRPAWLCPDDLTIERAMDSLLGHDVELIARHAGIDRRRMNQQRESQHHATNWLRRLVKAMAVVEPMQGGRQRCEPIARLVAEAAGLDICYRIPVTTLEALSTPVQSAAHVLREAGEAVATTLRLAEGGFSEAEIPEAIKEIEQARSHLNQLEAVVRANKKPSGPRAVAR